MKKTFYVVAGIAALAALSAAGLIGLGWYEASPVSWPREAFEAQKWRATPREDRYRQFRDLQERHRLVGLSRAEVESLLGPPDSTAPDGRYLTYELKDGSKDHLTLNSIYFMRVWLDSQGKTTTLQVDAD